VSRKTVLYNFDYAAIKEHGKVEDSEIIGEKF